MPNGKFARDTQVSVEKSKAEIERTLRKYGATEFATGWSEEKGTAQVGFKLRNRVIRMVLSTPDRAESTRTPTGRLRRSVTLIEKSHEQAQRQQWRALALVIKAKLEAVETGITTIDDEFLAFVTLPDGSSIGEWATAQLDRFLAEGRAPPKLLGDGVRY